METNPTLQYKSLNDAENLHEGDTEIWYVKDTFIEYAWNGEMKRILDPHNLRKTHTLLGKIDLKDPEEIYCEMQGETWSPRGEANTLIQSLQLTHTSMSMGDVVVVDGKASIVERTGFSTIE